MRYAILPLILVAALALPSQASSPRGWSPIILPVGEYRREIKSMPIEHRPGRLLHVYGNSVRLIEQSRHGSVQRPVQQIVIGTPTLRSERMGRN